MNIYQNNTDRKDISRLHFEDEPRVQERQQVKDQQSTYPLLWHIQQFHVAARRNPEEILNGKLRFLCSAVVWYVPSPANVTDLLLLLLCSFYFYW